MIIRVSKREKYTIVSNEPIKDRRLSWEARGLLIWLLSKPDHWSINGEAIANEGKAGVDKVWRMLREMEDAGYLRRERVHNEQGRYRWETVLYEEPAPSLSLPSMVNPPLDKPALVNPALLNTDPVKTEKTKTEDINIFPHFWSLYPKKTDKKAAERAWRNLKPSAELAAKILARLQIFIDIDWINTEPQFIPYPASWLNSARWEDEIPVAHTSGSKSPAPYLGNGGMANLAKHIGLTGNGNGRREQVVSPDQRQLVSPANGRSDDSNVAGDSGAGLGAARRLARSDPHNP